MVAQMICATGVLDQMHYGIPSVHKNFTIFHESTNPNLNSHFPSLSVTVNWSYGHLEQHIKEKAQ